jgi:signal transduction histidine kinase
MEPLDRAADEPTPHEFRAVTRAAQHVWLAAAFLFVWLHFSYVQHRHLDWQIYTLYFTSVAGLAARYLTGIRHGRRRWHRVVFDGLTILFIALGVNITGGIHSDLWLVYFIFVIAETLAASARGFLITDGVAVLSYVIATWPRVMSQQYVEMLGTRIFFLVLVASIARTIALDERKRREDLSALREELSVSEERRRLARDLHDGIGHVLTQVILSLEVARRQCTSDPPAAADSMAQQATSLRRAMEEMRQIVATLRTDTTSIDLRASVRAMTAQLAESGSLEVDVHLPVEPLPLSAHRQYHLSRVIQEALTNCLRHSGEDRARVEVEVVENPVGQRRVVAVVSDQGQGFDLQKVGGRGGHGLTGMSERLEPYGGKVRIESAPGEGTRITAEVPEDET